jgi:hypothetical protein
MYAVTVDPIYIYIFRISGVNKMMGSDNFVSVNAPDNHQCWDRALDHQEFVEVLETQKYLDDCAKYLVDVFQQAEKDIPRMSVKLSGIRIRCIRDLVRLIAPDQLPFVLTACTQTLWGYPYEVSVVASDLCVHERTPQSRCRIRLDTRDEEPPFRVDRVRGSKTLHASSPHDIERGRPAPFRVTLSIDMDALTTSIISVVKKRH